MDFALGQLVVKVGTCDLDMLEVGDICTVIQKDTGYFNLAVKRERDGRCDWQTSSAFEPVYADNKNEDIDSFMSDFE